MVNRKNGDERLCSSKDCDSVNGKCKSCNVCDKVKINQKILWSSEFDDWACEDCRMTPLQKIIKRKVTKIENGK